MKFLALFVCLVALALAGCGSKVGEASMIGKWKGEFKIPDVPKDDPMAKMAEGLLGMMAMNLEFKSGNVFVMTTMGIPMEGNWSMSGNTVTLTPTKIMGLTPEEAKKKNAGSGSLSVSKDPSEPMKFEVQADGKTMKALDPAATGDSKGELVFVKQE